MLNHGAAHATSAARGWSAILEEIDIDTPAIDRIVARAADTGSTVQREIAASGIISEEILYRTIARELDLEFVAHIDPVTLVLRDEDAVAGLGSERGIRIAMRIEENRATGILVAPELEEMRPYLARYPDMKERLRVVTPTALRQALLVRARTRLLDNATAGLFEAFPSLSARIVANAWQGACVGALAVGLPVALMFQPMATLLVIHAFATLFFLGCIALRVGATVSARDTRPELTSFRQSDMPAYTVLVAIYREAEMVPQLLAALGRLVWPRSKLEIKLVCESDDHETLAALKAQKLRPFIEVVEVPASLPRTKPKALAYALAATSGELVALFDAEDRPHPLQLIEAWQRFAADDGSLACLQAPLDIANPDESVLSRMFRFEYSGLFHGLLPWLARRDLFLPLGGTSNHFRRSVLEEVGGWDPYNVTEDADLGLRLKRFGYRIGTISFPTVEDGPTGLGIWLRQRTRWFKGWLQTWLVHIRSPRRLYGDLGFRSFVLAQILMLGMVASALVHPLLVVTGGLMVHVLASGGGLNAAQATLLVVDLVNILCGYLAFLAMGWRTLPPRDRESFWKVVLMTPVYWMLMSVAAWRAVWQLYRDPHHWEKTVHTPSTVDQRRKPGPSPMILPSSSPIFSRSRPS